MEEEDDEEEEFRDPPLSSHRFHRLTS